MRSLNRHARGCALGAGLLLAFVSTGVWSAPKAGEVVKVAGRAAAATEDGDIRALSQGGDVNSGETVVTSRNSFVRLKFVDGAYVILRPNTRFHIEDYQVAEKPEENRSFFNLVKGGFRTVTGLIGKRNRNGYRVRTAVATIGIRGTDYEVLSCEGGSCGGHDDGLYVNVHDAEGDGGVWVETGGRRHDLGRHQRAQIRSDTGFVQLQTDEGDPTSDQPLSEASCE